jgi:glycosyltransferase involved in cell wall biosynthesis
MPPSVSVVIPVYNDHDHLRLCLESLRASELQPTECIVVDDGSTDDSAGIAARYGAKVLSTNGRFGPARARNLGAQSACGDILLFLDADVCVHADTVSKVANEFLQDPSLDAVMGSYDRSPASPDYISQFRNLMHCFVHQQSNRQATTFWAGCGAIRRQVFLDFGGFNEKYRLPSIEDIELGYRMAHAGRKLALNADIQVKHLKRWIFRSMIKTDFFYRALPWSELSLRFGRLPNDLNLRISQRISVALVFLLIALGADLAIRWHAIFLVPLFATLFLLLSDYWVEGSVNRSRPVMALMVTNLSVIVGLSYWYHMYPVIPAVLVAWLGLFARHRYACSSKVWRKRTAILVGGYFVLATGFVWVYLPFHPREYLFVLFLVTLVALNKQFYMFLAAGRGKLFAVAAIPFHLLYFASSGLAFTVAVIRHGFGRLLGVPAEVPKVFVRAEADKPSAAAR